MEHPTTRVSAHWSIPRGFALQIFGQKSARLAAGATLTGSCVSDTPFGGCRAYDA